MDTFLDAGVRSMPQHFNESAASAAAWSATDFLSLITVVGSSLSLAGLVFSFITYSLFSDVRTLSSTMLMNLFAAMFLSQLLFVVGTEKPKDKNLCLGLALCLQYLCAATFSWLFALTHQMYLTFRTNINLTAVPETKMKSYFLKYTILAWGGPLLSSAINFANRPELADHKVPQAAGNCWSLGVSLLSIVSLHVPILILVLTTVFYLIKSSIVMRYIASLQVSPAAKMKMMRRRRLQLWLYFKLLSFLTITWISQGLAFLEPQHWLFWYIYVSLESIKGLMVSMSYTCNTKVLSLYAKSFKKYKKTTVSYGSSDLSHTTSLQLLTWDPQPDVV